MHSTNVLSNYILVHKAWNYPATYVIFYTEKFINIYRWIYVHLSGVQKDDLVKASSKFMEYIEKIDTIQMCITRG